MKVPNNVTNKLMFDPNESERIFSRCMPSADKFDFDSLIPMPPSVYRGDLSSDDRADFPLNWNDWARTHWGTKWNAYFASIGVCEDGRAYIKFDTAWAVPYPVITAFANIFMIDFEHKYFDEDSSFWGIETWQADSGRAKRIMTRKNNREDYRLLSIELLGRDPEAVDFVCSDEGEI